MKIVPLPPDEVGGVVRELGRTFHGSRIVVTGARGFLGRWFTSVLAKAGATVYAVDKWALAAQMGAAPLDMVADNIIPIDADVTKIGEVSRLVPAHLDYVLSLAGIASPVHYKRFPLETFFVSALGTHHMLELAANTGAKLLYSSSSEVYADPILVPTPESFVGAIPPFTERSAYDVGKLAGEVLCGICDRAKNPKVSVVRYFNVYGPGLSPNDYRVMCVFARAAIRGEALTVHGYGDQTRTFCYVTDAVLGTLQVLLQGDFGPYNVGNAKPEVSMRELAALFAGVTRVRLGHDLAVENVNAPSEYTRQPRRRCPDLTRVNDLGYTPAVTLETGIGRFLDWAKMAYRE